MEIWKYDASENPICEPVFLGEFSCILSFLYIIR